MKVKRIHFRVYKDADTEWRWALIAKNSKILADSGESYRRKAECLKAVEKIKNQAAYAEVETE